MAPPTRKRLTIQKRFRSVPFRYPFTRAVIVSAIFLLSAIALMTSILGFALLPTQKSGYFVLATFLTTIAIWIISILIRRSARCPLCKGTPYFSSGAHKHEKATKLPLLGYGMSNVFRSITNQTFRCMYCGQPFDMMKPVNKALSGDRKK